MSAVTQFIRNTMYQSFNDLFLRFISAVSGIIIIRYLTKNDYGLLALIMAVVGFVNYLSNLGYPTMIMKSISQYYSTDLPKAASYYRFTLKVYGAISVVFSAALLLSAPLIATAYGMPQTVNLYRIAALWFLLMSLFSFYNWTFVGLNRFKNFFLKVCLPKEILTLILVIVFLYVGLGLKGVIFAQMLGIALALVIAVGVCSPMLCGSAEIDRRWIVKGALEMTPANLAYASTVYVDVIVIGAILSTDLLASYRACLAVIQIALSFFPIGTFVLPTFNQVGRERAEVLLNDILKLTLIVALPAMFFLSSFSREIITILFGAKYSDSHLVLSIFAFSMMGYFVAMIFDGAMSFLERFKALSKIWAFCAFLNIVLLVVLTKYVGLVGAVAATLIFRYLVSLLMGYDINRNGLKLELRPLLQILLIGGVLIASLLVIRVPSIATRAVTFAASLAVYLWVLKFRGVFAGLEILKEIRKKLSVSSGLNPE